MKKRRRHRRANGAGAGALCGGAVHSDLLRSRSIRAFSSRQVLRPPPLFERRRVLSRRTSSAWASLPATTCVMQLRPLHDPRTPGHPPARGARCRIPVARSQPTSMPGASAWSKSRVFSTQAPLDHTPRTRLQDGAGTPFIMRATTTKSGVGNIGVVAEFADDTQNRRKVIFGGPISDCRAL